MKNNSPLNLIGITGRNRDHLVQKVQNLEDAKKMTYPRYASQKIDGVYCMAIKCNDSTFIYSRRGEVYNSMPHLQESFNHMLSNHDVVIFEAYIPGTSQEIISGYARDTKQIHSELQARCHQYLQFDELLDGGVYTYEEGLDILIDKVLNKEPMIKIIPQYLIQSEKMAMTLAEMVWKLGGEGIVLRDPMAVFQPGKRNSTMTRIKQVITFDLMCVDTFEGTGKYKGMIGGIICRFKDNTTVKIGTGLKDKERSQPPSHFIGRVVEVEAMKISPKGLLREARFKRFRDDKKEGEF